MNLQREVALIKLINGWFRLYVTGGLDLVFSCGKKGIFIGYILTVSLIPS